jgi:hypothetical protein
MSKLKPGPILEARATAKTGAGWADYVPTHRCAMNGAPGVEVGAMPSGLRPTLRRCAKDGAPERLG